ncbi:MAG TPA: tetratricopeptide repeat protein, partial [Pyrinomonadaceae bacterium]|nr:tetratricopeptide repeat protein [Pyrinomonadaceae bacterium]
MYFRSVLFPLLLLSIPFQSQGELFRQRYEAAEAHRRAGNLPGAEAQYASILSESYYKLGRIYSAQNNYQGAVGVLEAAVAYGPESQNALIDLAIAYFYTRQYKQALEPLNKALALDSQNLAAYHMLGKTYFMLSEFEKSTSELLTAMRLAPKDYDVAYTLGLAYLKRRQRAPAKQIFDRMIVELGNRPQLRVLIGRAYRETGFLPEAIDEFKKAAALDATFPRVHYYLGLTYLLKDGASRLSDAEAEFRLELAAHPKEFFANYYLGIVSTIERKWDVALDFLLEASRIQPNNPDPYFYLGQTYQGLAKHEQAIEVLKKAIVLNPGLSHNDYQVTNAHYRLGQSLIKVGRTEEGQKELQVASDLKSKAFKRDEAKAEAFINAADLNDQTEFPELVRVAGMVGEPDALDGQKKQVLTSDASFFAKVIGTAHDNIGLLRAERQDFRNAAEHFR